MEACSPAKNCFLIYEKRAFVGAVVTKLALHTFVPHTPREPRKALVMAA